MRTKLTVKNPKPASPTRAPVRSGSLVARKAVRPAAPPAGDKPARPKQAPAAAGERAFKPRGSAGAERAPAQRAPRDAGAERGARAPYRDNAASEGAKRSFGDRRTSSDRPPRRSDDDARPRRAGGDDSKRPSYRDNAAGEGAKRSFGDRRTSSDRPPRRNDDDTRPRRAGADEGKRPSYRDKAAGEGAKRSFGDRPARPARDGERRAFGAVKTAQPVKRQAADIDHGDETGLMRLSKRMSELGLCSRREADEWIEKGWVLVDGERIDTLGTKVRPDQKIEIDERASAAQAAQVTILLHKPVGYVSGQAEDGYEPAAVLITRANQWSGDRSPVRFSPQHLHALAPAGRLDIDSTGLLVLTQNGVIAKQLIGEQSDIDKEYLVRVRFGERLIDIDQHFPAESLAKLRHGLELDGVALKPAMVSWQNGEQLRFVLREGKKRQIRRMCELVGLEVIGLKRVRMGRVMLGALPQGQWRYLSADESF